MYKLPKFLKPGTENGTEKSRNGQQPHDDRHASGYDSDGLWKAGFAAFPQPLENPAGFPQAHSLDDGHFRLDFL
jgi:hypothetical protein